MGRFEKLNRDVYLIANKMLDDQYLCKLIHYPDINPLDQPDVNGLRDILNKRLLLFTPKFPLGKEVGTFVSIRVPTAIPSAGGYYIASGLWFDIFVHNEKSREIYYLDDDGKYKRGSRALMIVDRIEKIMADVWTGIGKDNLDGIYEIANNDATFAGYSLRYKNIDFRE